MGRVWHGPCRGGSTATQVHCEESLSEEEKGPWHVSAGIRPPCRAGLQGAGRPPGRAGRPKRTGTPGEYRTLPGGPAGDGSPAAVTNSFARSPVRPPAPHHR
ncbi:hypothetical protein GCM10012285_33060 [Streptomyces kronopolitis]|uniref:Uncharacterized protein n=1 Tax=Streptomyces kronopolitis TaxID=1612435 RepID=A0ABQ2JH44_9ACTN|nr:hypothetical protein GCM10012285_33060 [Streptomyces kronopolitis]